MKLAVSGGPFLGDLAGAIVDHLWSSFQAVVAGDDARLVLDVAVLDRVTERRAFDQHPQPIEVEHVIEVEADDREAELRLGDDEALLREPRQRFTYDRHADVVRGGELTRQQTGAWRQAAG
ncbi:MAG TPA: hypothetical protein VG223_01580 [Solirubrobacteraceae bacterium]|nr:hypothetical protein [Solirubrobacteraceae bacterium]